MSQYSDLKTNTYAHKHKILSILIWYNIYIHVNVYMYVYTKCTLNLHLYVHTYACMYVNIILTKMFNYVYFTSIMRNLYNDRSICECVCVYA